MSAAFSASARLSFPERPAEGDFIVDDALLLTEEHADEIQTIAQETLEETAVPILVVTIDSMAEYGAHRRMDIERYARELFDHWGIGHPTVQVQGGEIPRNLGVLLLVSVGDRKARIELGADWGHRKDFECEEIMQDHIIASFKRDQFSVGILSGVRGLAAMVRDEPIPSPIKPWWYYGLWIGLVGLGLFTIVSLVRRGSSGWAWVFWGAVFAILGFILYNMMRARRHRSIFSGGGGGFTGGSFGGGFSGGGGATGSW
jgi:uncharacterized protein